MTIRFGTDGWRAVISEEFTFDNVRKVSQAIADKTLADLAQANGARGDHPLTMVVGFDTRFLSDRYAWAVAEVLAANGIRAWLVEADAPTPVVSYAIVDKHADGGVMITASHNPPRYNGLKLKAAYGGSASSAASKEIERRIAANESAGALPRTIDLDTAIAQGLVQRFDPFPAYAEHIRKLVNFATIRRASLSVVVDAMYGAGRRYLSRLLEEAGCQVTELRGEMNPGFNGIHPEPIARNLQLLLDTIRSGDYEIGLATDGDADRIGAVDPTGRFIDPHCVMALLVEHLVLDRGLRGSVVKTVSTTQMLNRLAARYGLTIHETPVGFNHICDLMLGEEVLVGGEESGGISMLGHIPEGDGVLLGLLLVEMVATRGKTLSALTDELMAAPDIGKFCYARHDQPVRPFNKAELVAELMSSPPPLLAGLPVAAMNDKDGVKYIRSDESWLLIRPSGTEPVLRIYAEARSDAAVQLLLAEGAKLAERQIEAYRVAH
jgi:alpha-D-glucose phosphate-specific phosphoglucomutase